MATVNNIKLFLTDLVHNITFENRLPLGCCLFIELISNLQTLSLSLFPLLSGIPTSQNKLSTTINQMLSYLEPFKIFNPFHSGISVGIIFTLCSLYFVLYLSMIGYIAFQREEKSSVKEALCKIVSSITTIHSKALFYFIHCFTMRAIYCSHITSLNCTAAMVTTSAILLVLNVTITLFQELFCYQIHQNKFAYGLKTNLHNFIKFAHKFLMIILFCTLQDSAKNLIFLNILFTIFDLFILHSRLPFFNLKMLKFSITCSTITAFFAIVTIYRMFEAGENLCLIVLPILPFILKISIMKLNQTLRNILSFALRTPYHTVHLPNLIEDYLQKHAISPLADKLNKSTLYSMGFLRQEAERIFVTSQEKHPQITAQETRKAAYSKALEIMTQTLQKYPKSEILRFSIAQIYLQVFEDSFKALDVVNKTSHKDQSFAGRVSVKALSNDFAAINPEQDMNQVGTPQEKRRNSHLSYFAYREKIQFFKSRIKLEIQEHLKLWNNFSSPQSDVFNAVNQASLISFHTHEITKCWYKNFEGQESFYVNASLMYGLYLEIVQAIPSGGHAFIKKAYSGINNKWHVWRDVIDVTVGNSAIIVASIEPDKIGRILDTSSSVKEMFKTSKQGLVGTNIAVLIPNFIAVKHNDLIRGHQKYFTGGLDHHISSYAKTLQDEYFKAEITLHVSPLTHRGLNLISYIKKLSEYQSLMIVDPKGNIVEYSKDLSAPLNLFMKRSHVKIETLCPDFKKINQAFAVLYKNTENNDDAQTNKRDDQTEFDNILPKPRNAHYLESIDPLLSPTSQRLPSNFVFESYRGDTPLHSNSNNEKVILDKNITEPMMDQHEAQEIWDSFKDCKELTFHPYNKNGEETKYAAEIEPYFFDNKWYKIIKMKSPAPQSRHMPPSNEMRKIDIPEPGALDGDDFADDFSSIEERTEAERMANGRRKTSLAIQYIKDNEARRLSFDEKIASQIFEEKENFTSEPANDGGQINTKKFSIKAQSQISSQATQNMTAKKLNDSLKMERQSTSSRLVIVLVYFTAIVIVSSVYIHLISTKSSLDEMTSSINLVKTVNTRLGKTILSWQAMMILYTRAIKLRPIDYKIPMYQAVSISASLAVLQNAKELAEQVDEFANQDLVSSLYAKNIILWEPLDHTLFDNHLVDQFSANQVLIDYYLWIARYNGSYLDLASNREFLFAINNTANDYLLALDQSISDLTLFFDDTKDKNIRLITGITIMEILLVLSPFVLILIIFFIIIRTYSKLFQAICQINENSLVKRIRQLEHISALFEENLEDDVSPFHKFKSEGLTIKVLGKRPALTFREFRVQDLAIRLSKYVSLAAGLIIIVVVLIVITLKKSIQDLENLGIINKKVLTVYSAGSQIRMIQPTFQIDVIFYNDTSYKIRNDAPAAQLQDQLDALDDASNLLLSVLTDSNGEISDPVVKDILDGNVCKYVTSPYYLNCVQNTKGGAYGLLGLHSFYSQVCQCVRDWLNTATPTFTLGIYLSTQYAILVNNVPFVLFDIYDYLSNYLVETFIETAEEDKTQIQEMFYWNLAAVLVTMFLIRVVVLTRLQVFDLGIRRILRIIPYRIIEENKVMSCYLARTFQDELNILKQLN